MNVARVQVPALTPYVGCSREVFLRVLQTRGLPSPRKPRYFHDKLESNVMLNKCLEQSTYLIGPSSILMQRDWLVLRFLQ